VKDEPSWLPVTCGGCGQSWYGFDRAHATCCHRTFDLLDDFDRHRVDGRCANPVSLGLYRHERSAVWMRRVQVVASRRRAS